MPKKNEETISTLPINSLHPFENHPFKVQDDEAMKDMVKSIKEYGVLTPIAVMPKESGGFEIISGHRRVKACEIAGIDKIPAIIRNISRDEAIIMMVDSNLQRESILPSEKAKAYKMKLEALKRQGKRTDLETVDNQGFPTSPQVGEKLRKENYSVSKLAKDTNESVTQIQRYIRLNELHPDIQKKVDEKEMGITPAVELSYLNKEEQELLIETMESEDCTPSLSQAQTMKKMSQSGELNEDTMLEIMMKPKKRENRDITISGEILSKYLPKNYTLAQATKLIVRLLERWYEQMKKREEKKISQSHEIDKSKKKSEHSL